MCATLWLRAMQVMISSVKFSHSSSDPQPVRVTCRPISRGIVSGMSACLPAWAGPGLSARYCHPRGEMDAERYWGGYRTSLQSTVDRETD